MLILRLQSGSFLFVCLLFQAFKKIWKNSRLLLSTPLLPNSFLTQMLNINQASHFLYFGEIWEWNFTCAKKDCRRRVKYDFL